MVQPIQLKYLSQFLSRVPALEGAVVFHAENGKWKAHEDDQSIDLLLAQTLRTLKTGNRVRRLKKPSRAVIRVAKGELAVVLEVPPRTRDKTLNAHADRMEECFTSATSAYHAHHDELTGVLNRHGIRAELQRCFSELYQTSSHPQNIAQQSSGDSDLVLFALDIDRFKSVNDTFGHEVGDLVLSVFAERLTQLAVELSEKYRAKFLFGRPGGEEFELIGFGALPLNEVREIGDLVLRAIRQPELPSQVEIERFVRLRNPKSSVEAGRYPNRVTASVGVAAMRTSRSVVDLESLHSQLRNEADAALYRAKSDGRNCIRVHEEIRRKYGRVFSYHETSNLAVIDIGANVGVSQGHVFDVYYPPFTGGEKIQQDDKSSKVLGEYPAVPAARVMVTHVQRETSTCVIVFRKSQGPIPTGSRLGYVYTGAAITITDHSSPHSPLLHPLSELRESVEHRLKEHALGPVCAFSGILPHEELARGGGLQEFFTILHGLFPVGTMLFRGPSAGAFAVLPNRDEFLDRDKVVSTLAEVCERVEAVIDVNVTVGVYLPPLHDPGWESSSNAILFYSRAALLQEIGTQEKVRIFDPLTGRDLIYKWRRDSEPLNGLIDYQRLRQYGIGSDQIDNQIGLLILENDFQEYYAFAETSFYSASKANPIPVYKANLGLMRAQKGNFAQAFHDLDSVKGYVGEHKESYLLAYARSALALHQAGEQLSIDLAELLMQAADELPKRGGDAAHQNWAIEISRALKSGDFD